MSVLSKRIKAIENELIQPIQPPKFIHILLCTHNDDSDIIGYGYEGIKVMRIENESIDDLQERAHRVFIENDTRGDQPWKYFVIHALYGGDEDD
jgi:hypothetical protein